MNEKIIFGVLNAKFVHASPAPYCLAAGVQAYAPNHYERVQIVEATINQSLEDILKHILQTTPAIVSFSCYLWNIEMTLELTHLIKRELPQTIILLGGPEVSYCATQTLQNNAQIDYILSGEGETSMPAMLSALLRSGTPTLLTEADFPSISGLCARRANGEIYEDQACVLSGDVPSPLSVGYAQAMKGRIAYVETSRGCPYSCAFCLSGRCGSPRFFSLDAVYEDLLRLANSDTRTIKFVDRTFNANPRHANAILRFILTHYGKEIPLGVCFHFEIAGDILREETFELLEQMPLGAVQLEIGMQSFCEKTLEAVRRKTNTTILKKNIDRLVAMKNMHIHIDLIAGLPFEDVHVFADSFNTGYALGAQMLQVGFLKLLHGSAMRDEPDSYPCTFDAKPPYEVSSTPWLSPDDLSLLHRLEDAVERVYNSGRFLRTAKYLLESTGKSPFDFYLQLGLASYEAGLRARVALGDYTAFLFEYCSTLQGVERESLRDCIVRDRFANSSERLHVSLHKQDTQLSWVAKRLAISKDTAPLKGIRRNVAILYGADAVCWADYVPQEKNPVTGEWIVHEIPMKQLFP